jgi:hypothetical protein
MLRNPVKPALAVVLLALLMTSTQSGAQQEHPESGFGTASGTLNLVLANKNGFVVAADSRMSSDHKFLCDGKEQLYCDNSQKLFRTTPHSAMVVAGFAVGGYKSPLFMAVASAIRKQFGPGGMPEDRFAVAIPSAAEMFLQSELTGVAAIYDPANTPAKNLSLWATFVRMDSDGTPIVHL